MNPHLSLRTARVLNLRTRSEEPIGAEAGIRGTLHQRDNFIAFFSMPWWHAKSPDAVLTWPDYSHPFSSAWTLPLLLVGTF